MVPAIQLTEILAKSVVYDHYTRLFPFSPRREVTPDLIERLRKSMSETGMWQPIVVRIGTMEGIAGNHRFLAYLELAEEQKHDLETLTIPAMLVDCDEGMAVTIGLIEDELRENLTPWESVQAVLKAFEKKPKTVEKVLEVDTNTVERFASGKANSTMRPRPKSSGRHSGRD